MVRWRLCVFLAILIVLPNQSLSKSDEDLDDDDEESTEENGEENEEDDEGAEEDAPVRKQEPPEISPQAVSTTPVITRTTMRRPLECFVCAYKPETNLRSCLDPIKYRVHTMMCKNVEDKCFTSTLLKKNSYEAVIRGCKSGCVPSTETTCCDSNDCNDEVLHLPATQQKTLARARASTQNKSAKTAPTTVLLFISVLVLLQTVVKVIV